MDRRDSPIPPATGLAEKIEMAANLRADRARDRDDRATERDDASRARDRDADLRDQRATERDAITNPQARRLAELLLQARKELRRFPRDERSGIEDILSEALDGLHHWQSERASAATADRGAAAGDRTSAAGDRARSADDRDHSAGDRDQAIIEHQQVSVSETDKFPASTRTARLHRPEVDPPNRPARH